ncbi:MAG: uncharacterized protein QOF51_1562 [Chloroflexota bacterium]|nr:uncharacterized protein [Chloroflexota bacterium]
MATDGNRANRPAVIVTNETRGEQLVASGRIARSMWARGRGLLGTRSLDPGDGLLIEQCQSIHSFWMRYPFDALFLDRQGRIVHLIKRMKPNRISRHVFAARAVLELPAGTIEATGTEHGDVLRWTEPQVTRAAQ